MFMFVAYFNFFMRVCIIVIIILVTSFCYRTTVLFLDVDELIQDCSSFKENFDC